jgi:uncharacterized protein YkwD
MTRVTLIWGVVRAVCLLATASVAACGGGSERSARASVPKPPAGGVVGAELTAGRLGPAEMVRNGRIQVTGQPGPISPADARPTDGQRTGVAGAAGCTGGAAAPGADNLAALAATVGCLLNAERARAGLRPLASNPQLRSASQRMATLMVRQQFFAHDTPDGRTLVDRVRPTGYVTGRWALGENLAWGSGALATPQAIVNGWMHSSGHRSNILYASFRDVGIGVALGPPSPTLTGGATYVTDFGKHG